MDFVKCAFLFVAALCGSRIFAVVPQEPRRIEINASRYTFSPEKITLKKDEAVVLVFRTTDVNHGIKVPELNILADISKGKDTEIPLKPETAGHFAGECSHFCGSGHGSMKMEIDVVE